MSATRHKGPVHGCRFNLTVRRFYVVRDVCLRAGDIVNGEPVPAGMQLTRFPVGEALHSKLQTKKALRRVRRRFPGAYVVIATHRKGFDMCPGPYLERQEPA